jgi:hypothetical protein
MKTPKDSSMKMPLPIDLVPAAIDLAPMLVAVQEEGSQSG